MAIDKVKDMVLGRAKVLPRRSMNIILLPIKESLRHPLNKNDLLEVLQSLRNVISELRLNSVAFFKIQSLEGIPWDETLQAITNTLPSEGIHVNVIISLNKVTTPEKEQRENLIRLYHASELGGHKGVTKTYKRIRERYVWENMKRQIQDYIKSCTNCQKKKLVRVKTRQPMILTDTPGTAFEKIAIDTVGPIKEVRGFRYYLTIICLLTKYLVAVPLPDISATTVASAFLDHFLNIYGPSRYLVSDKGTSFLNAIFRYLLKKFKMKHVTTTSYYPQSNGTCERSHHTLTEYLKQNSTHDDWVSALPSAVYSYNTSVHESTNCTPYELIFGKLPDVKLNEIPIPEQVSDTYYHYLHTLHNRLSQLRLTARAHVEESKKHNKIYYDKRRNVVEFKVGDMVYYLKEPIKSKFDDQYDGPAVILEIHENHNVVLQLRNGKTKLIHMNKIKKA